MSIKKLIFVILFLFIAVEYIVFENIFSKTYYLLHQKNIYIATYYGVVTIFGYLSVSLFMFIKRKAYFFLYLCILLLTYGVELTYKQINATGFSINDLNIALSEAGNFAVDAISTYGDSIENAFIFLFSISLIILLIRFLIQKNNLFIKTKYIVVVFFVALLLSYTVIKKTAASTQTQPVMIKMINKIIYNVRNGIYAGERNILEENPITLSQYDNIILIVDESIGGQYLSINGYQTNTTPYLQSIKDKYINLGLASSGANCSAASNIILMSGIQLKDFPDKDFKTLQKPSIFQYAKNAGYRTHYISEQSHDMILQNYMTEDDLKYIDSFIQPKGGYKLESIPEHNIIKSVKKALDISRKNFIFIVKHGAHFHYENTYPEDKKIFTPTLKKNEPLSLKNKDRVLNSYANSIRYNVDLFFKYFLKETNFYKRKNTLLIYTSDHGQSMLENGRKATHCDSTNPPLTQGIVPLLVFNTQNNNTELLGLSKDIYSHYQIFPTILHYMGYKNLHRDTFMDINKTSYIQKFESGDLFGRTGLQFNDISVK